jgi:hypothetical protein
MAIAAPATYCGTEPQQGPADSLRNMALQRGAVPELNV